MSTFDLIYIIMFLPHKTIPEVFISSKHLYLTALLPLYYRQDPIVDNKNDEELMPPYKLPKLASG